MWNDAHEGLKGLKFSWIKVACQLSPLTLPFIQITVTNNLEHFIAQDSTIDEKKEANYQEVDGTEPAK